MSDPRLESTLHHLITLLKRNDLPDAVARTIIPPLQTDIPAAHWSLGNRLLMPLHSTEDARGYRQWEAVDRHPIKGAKAFYIWAPRSERVDPSDHEATPPLIGFRPVPVFRFEDTDGAPLMDLDGVPTELPPLSEVAAALGSPCPMCRFGATPMAGLPPRHTPSP